MENRNFTRAKLYVGARVPYESMHDGTFCMMKVTGFSRSSEGLLEVTGLDCITGRPAYQTAKKIKALVYVKNKL